MSYTHHGTGPRHKGSPQAVSNPRFGVFLCSFPDEGLSPPQGLVATGDAANPLNSPSCWHLACAPVWRAKGAFYRSGLQRVFYADNAGVNGDLACSVIFAPQPDDAIAISEN